MAANDVYRGRLGYWAGPEWCTFHVDYRDVAGQPESSAAQDLLAILNPVFSTEFMPFMGSDVQLSSLYCRNLTQAAMPARFQYTNITGPVSNGTALPFTKCAVFSRKSNDPAVVRQSRIYVSGIAKNTTAAGVIGGSWLAVEYKAFADKLAETLTGAGGDWVPVLTRTVNAGLPIAPTPYDIDSVSAQPVIYSQRRRQGRARSLV